MKYYFINLSIYIFFSFSSYSHEFLVEYNAHEEKALENLKTVLLAAYEELKIDRDDPKQLIAYFLAYHAIRSCAKTAAHNVSWDKTRIISLRNSDYLAAQNNAENDLKKKSYNKTWNLAWYSVFYNTWGSTYSFLYEKIWNSLYSFTTIEQQQQKDRFYSYWKLGTISGLNYLSNKDFIHNHFMKIYTIAFNQLNIDTNFSITNENLPSEIKLFKL